VTRGRFDRPLSSVHFLGPELEVFLLNVQEGLTIVAAIDCEADHQRVGEIIGALSTGDVLDDLAVKIIIHRGVNDGDGAGSGGHGGSRVVVVSGLQPSP